ncbi:MAG: DUF6265 family protein [Phaeodactylibacter sp.]|uniref:DUF6265 family protein n=1 Tax=Phaeodactylibacter sp. TaxID=1940289 RepID=UPI0032EB88C8
MASKKDLFSIFQDNRHLFDSTPSPRAWDRLERRLDGHRRRNRFSMLRTFSMAAAVLFLAVLGVLISVAVGEKPARLLNKGPQPLASEQLPADDIEAAEELRQTLNTQQAEKQRQRPINEGPTDRKLVLAKDRSNSTALESLNRLQWLEGDWQPQDAKAHAAIHWEKVGRHALKGELQHSGTTEHIRIFEEGGTLYFSTDLGKEAQARFALQYATPGMAVFERDNDTFPQKVILSRSKHNRLMLRYEPKSKGNAQGLLLRKQQVREWYKIQLQ